MPKLDKRQIIDISEDPGLSREKKSQVSHKVKSEIEIPQFHLNLDKPDPRDYRYSLIPTKTKTTVDLRPYCTPIEDQGNLGSCTGNAIAGAIELLNKRNNKPTDVSRLYIYYFERVLMGTVNYDSGAYIRDGIKATNKFGASLERLWPYNISQFRTQPIREAINDGAKRKVTLYERIDNFDGCINALANGYPVIFGFLVYSSFLSANVAKTGRMPYPNISRESMLGGHAVLMVGYDIQKSVFIVRNSWGSRWGDKGYFYMPFDVVKNSRMSFDFWIIKQVQNP